MPSEDDERYEDEENSYEKDLQDLADKSKKILPKVLGPKFSVFRAGVLIFPLTLFPKYFFSPFSPFFHLFPIIFAYQCGI